ncbi:DUF262 domain-containing protein [Helicobacter pylori]
MAKIESKDSHLRDILKDEFYYQIPIYQRPYQWTEENCEKLLDDLFFNYEDDRESDYFCGSLVLIAISEDSKAKTYDIVDGQQRLSTFILLAKVLATLYSERLNEESKDYLQESLNGRYGKKDRLNFNAIGFNSKKDFQYALTSFNDASVSNNKNNYLKNAVCLKNYLRKKEIEDINNFIEWLYFRVVFITITCPDADKALRIFNVLNARGLALSATDIFKGELLRHAKEHEQEEFVSRWNALSQKCSDNDLKIETLFSWYLTYLNPVTSRVKMEKRLVTWFKNLNKTPLEYLKGVEDFYNAYCEVLEMQDRYAYLLSYKDDDYLLCVILCTSLLHRYSDQEIEALKKLLVKFYYQDWVAGKTRATREQTCCYIINALKEKKGVEYIASIVKKYLDEKNITQHFKENLQDSNLYTKFYFTNNKTPKKNSWLKPILILVEYFMSDDPKPKRIQMDKNLHVEHILPQKPTLSSQWAKDFSEEEREHYTHSLANLTLLGAKKNTKASNLDFKDKKKIYMGEEIRLSAMTCYKMTIDIAHHYTEWTPKSLEKREKDLMSIIESVLTL